MEKRNERYARLGPLGLVGESERVRGQVAHTLMNRGGCITGRLTLDYNDLSLPRPARTGEWNHFVHVAIFLLPESLLPVYGSVFEHLIRQYGQSQKAEDICTLWAMTQPETLFCAINTPLLEKDSVNRFLAQQQGALEILRDRPVVAVENLSDKALVQAGAAALADYHWPINVPLSAHPSWDGHHHHATDETGSPQSATG